VLCTAEHSHTYFGKRKSIVSVAAPTCGDILAPQDFFLRNLEHEAIAFKAFNIAAIQKRSLT